MSWPRRKPAVPPRHPDPATERELERIRSLQRRTALVEAQMRSGLDHLGRLNTAQRTQLEEMSHSYHGAPAAVAATEKAIASERAEIRQLGLDLDRVHDEIAQRQQAMNPDDLAWLYPGKVTS